MLLKRHVLSVYRHPDSSRCAARVLFDLNHQIKRLSALLRRKTPQLTSLRVEPRIPEIKCLRLPQKCAPEIRFSFRGYTPRVGAFIEGDGGYCIPCFVGQVRYLRGHFSPPPKAEPVVGVF